MLIKSCRVFILKRATGYLLSKHLICLNINKRAINIDAIKRHKHRPSFFNEDSSDKPNFTPILRHLSSVEKHLIITPDSCLHDEPITIQAKNLKPSAEVTISSSITDTRNQEFFTYTHYRADESGTVDLNVHESVGGTYEGIFPIGPIAYLSPGPNERNYLRFVKKEIAQPLQVKFNLLTGHLHKNEAANPDPSLVMDSVVHNRLYMAPGTRRIPVRSGKIRGSLFLPKGNGPFPGVIDMFGSAGGLIETRAAQFASRGIAALALAYFDYEDLPNDLLDVGLDISYFEEAVQFLLSHEKIGKKGIGAIGVSKGGDLACSLGTFIPEVKAVVCINGLPVNTWCDLKTKDTTYPALFFDMSRAKILNQELISTMEMMNDSENYPETHLPLHEADAQFLFIVGQDDKNWKTELETNRAIDRMKAHGCTNYELLCYKGAGHLIEPPYSPFAVATYHKMAGAALLWGGIAKEHSDAQVDSWTRMISFFKKILT